jgi:hypothetical protein
MFHGCFSELFELQVEEASNEEVNDYAGALIDALVNGLSARVAENRAAGAASPSSSHP